MTFGDILCFHVMFSAVTGGWVGSSGARGVTSTQQVNGSPNTRASPVNDMLAAHEKVSQESFLYKSVGYKSL